MAGDDSTGPRREEVLEITVLFVLLWLAWWWLCVRVGGAWGVGIWFQGYPSIVG